MAVHYRLRQYNQARIQAELEGKTHYGGEPCKVNPDHVREDGTSIRDTFKYRCKLCRHEQQVDRNNKRRKSYRQKIPMHPSTEALLKYFRYDHLPTRPQAVSKLFADLAHALVHDLSLDGPELTVGLRKLLEAKDCAVRAALLPDAQEPEPGE